MDEKELVIKIQSGDMSAFEKLFQIYKNEAYRYSYLITGNKNISEDIVQEAFVACYAHIKNIKDPGKFKSWFFKILTRTAWKYLSKEKRSVPVDNIFEKADYDKNDDAMNEYMRKEQAEILREEIENLEIKQKTVIILYYFKEIADVMGCFEGTVKSRLYSARKKLKSILVKSEEYAHIGIKECGI